MGFVAVWPRGFTASQGQEETLYLQGLDPESQNLKPNLMLGSSMHHTGHILLKRWTNKEIQLVPQKWSLAKRKEAFRGNLSRLFSSPATQHTSPAAQLLPPFTWSENVPPISDTFAMYYKEKFISDLQIGMPSLRMAFRQFFLKNLKI